MLEKKSSSSSSMHIYNERSLKKAVLGHASSTEDLPRMREKLSKVISDVSEAEEASAFFGGEISDFLPNKENSQTEDEEESSSEEELSSSEESTSESDLN